MAARMATALRIRSCRSASNWMSRRSSIPMAWWSWTSTRKLTILTAPRPFKASVTCRTPTSGRFHPKSPSKTATPSFSAVSSVRKKTRPEAGFHFSRTFRCSATLFTSQSSKKTRDEALVLIRPTVLKTPELAAAQTKLEEARLPGISHAEEEDARDERKQIEAENKSELKSAAHGADNAELFQPASPNGTIDTNNNTQPNPGHDSDGNELFQPASPKWND